MVMLIHFVIFLLLIIEKASFYNGICVLNKNYFPNLIAICQIYNHDEYRDYQNFTYDNAVYFCNQNGYYLADNYTMFAYYSDVIANFTEYFK